ncbi:MAG: hypothetical protein JOZ02_24075 [Acidobacteria bacterium]|nr:hypothetical protein [Acidobacteriota bacterium]
MKGKVKKMRKTQKGKVMRDTMEGIARFNSSERSARYKAALKALRELAEEEGLDKAKLAHAEATWDIRLEQWAGSNGLTKSKRHGCIATLLGEKCEGIRYDGIPCSAPGGDHTSFWLRDGEPAVYISQPYALRLPDMQELLSLSQKYDLDVTIHPADESFYFPGGTLMVEIRSRSGKKVYG